MKEDYGNLKIQKELLNKIDKRIQETDFKSVDEYVTFVLEEIIKEIEEEPKNELSKEDEDNIKERLRALGYLD
jgi:Arc/MetJ-type ribon-helix-helix transcriptional regulator